MKYIYDINLCFNDYYLNYYEWEKVERYFRLPIFKVSDIKPILENIVNINTDYKTIIVSDGINSLALELIDNKSIYYSSLEYNIELKVNELVADINDLLDYQIVKPNNHNHLSNIDKKKDFYLKEINSNKNSFIKYLYYEINGNILESESEMKKILIDDINNNFSEKYYQLYDIINIGE